MLLAAGVGERMRPLTDRTPKPLLKVAALPLIEYHIRRLAEAGLSDLVINVSHLGEQIMDYCGDGSRWGLSINYSIEEMPLETAGGIINAMPLLGEQVFMVVNGDVWTDYPFELLANRKINPESCEAHLVFVANPEQHPRGDYSLDNHGLVGLKAPGAMGHTYAGIGLYSPRFFHGVDAGKLALRPLLDRAISAGVVSGEVYQGEWVDVGTPERLNALDEMVSRA